VTTQSLKSKPSKAFVIETNEVLTIVVSRVDRKRLTHNLPRIRLDVAFVRTAGALKNSPDCQHMESPAFNVGGT
jgi:hypothetical protein